MAEVAQTEESPAPGPDKPMEYDAFLSYAHLDKQVTTAIQKGLHQIGRRVGQLRALRVFRDDTNLTANPDLWGKITDALDSSRFMIVVLSPQSAASHWVNEEVSYWLQHRGHEQLMLVLAEGHLHPQRRGAGVPHRGQHRWAGRPGRVQRAQDRRQLRPGLDHFRLGAAAGICDLRLHVRRRVAAQRRGAA